MKHLDKKSLKKILSLITESPEKGFQYLTELQAEATEATAKVFAQMSGGYALKDLVQKTGDDAEMTEIVETLRKLVFLDKGGLLDSQGLVIEAPLRVANLADAYGLIEGWAQRVATIACNPQEASDLRQEDSGAIGWEEEGDAIRKGSQGELWGATIFVSKDIPPDRVWVLSDNENLFSPSGLTKTPLGPFDPKAIVEIRVKRS